MIDQKTSPNKWRPDGHIAVETELLNEKLYRGPISRIPFLRGLVMQLRRPPGGTGADTVFSGRWGGPWSPDGADQALVTALEHARLAPSASNRQPWRFTVRTDDVALVLTRSAPIDEGIVMAHLALAFAALGREGAWQVCWEGRTLTRECGLPQEMIPVATFEW